jgi:hypothetical protein
MARTISNAKPHEDTKQDQNERDEQRDKVKDLE